MTASTLSDRARAQSQVRRELLVGLIRKDLKVKYQGSLLLDNWGAHGFSGPNRGVFHFAPDADGNIVTKEPFVACTDPHFRPSHILLDPDGNPIDLSQHGWPH